MINVGRERCTSPFEKELSFAQLRTGITCASTEKARQESNYRTLRVNRSVVGLIACSIVLLHQVIPGCEDLLRSTPD